MAWTYRTGETDGRFATGKPASLEATPLVVDGPMYIGTPLGRVIALDPATGQKRWVFDPNIARNIPYSDFASRGVSTWLDEAAPPDSPCRRRIYGATAQAQLIALDARDGEPCRDFGSNGIVDLKVGLRIPPFEPQAYSMTSPPVAVNGVVITGSSIGDNSRPDPASGEVRGYDARTGRLRWTWDPIPQDATDPAYAQWRGAMAHKGGGANAWSRLVADAERDLVFVPTGSAAPDYYGVLRLGDNRYANSIVALRATTGRLVWAFQTVHHDLWDYDNASPPALVSVRRNGVAVAAVVQTTKTGMMFVLERETGRPIFPVQERVVPASDIPDEQASPTQPFTTVTPPLSPHRFAANEVWGITNADREACRAAIAPLRNDGIFTPPSTRGTLLMPARIGGVNSLSRDELHHFGDPVHRDDGDLTRLIDRDSALRSARPRGRAATARRRFRIQHDAGHAVRRAPSTAAGAVPPAVHAASVRGIGRDRSHDRTQEVGGAAGIDDVSALA